MLHVSLCMFHRCAFLLEIPAYVVLLTFTWLLLSPTILAAQTLPRHHPEPAHSRTPRAEDELAETLARLAAQLTRRLQQRTTAVDTPSRVPGSPGAAHVPGAAGYASPSALCPGRAAPASAGTYHLVVRGTALAALPASLGHHVSVALYTSDLDLAQEQPALQYQISLPGLHTQRLGVTYMPATEADRQLISSYTQQGATALPAYLLRVTPLLQLDGRPVATGPVDTMGRRHIWSVTLRDRHDQYTRTEQCTGSAGDELVFGVNGNGLTEAVLRARLAAHASETAAENLSTLLPP